METCIEFHICLSIKNDHLAFHILFLMSLSLPLHSAKTRTGKAHMVHNTEYSART